MASKVSTRAPEIVPVIAPINLTIPFPASGVRLGWAPLNSVPAPSDEEVITAQGIQIWKKGRPKKAYRTLGFDRLEKQKGFPAAENKIARGVLARKGNAAIINTIQNSMRVNFDLNTQDENLDGIDIRYEIILLQP
jgi:hypothetical protein